MSAHKHGLSFLLTEGRRREGVERLSASYAARTVKTLMLSLHPHVGKTRGRNARTRREETDQAFPVKAAKPASVSEDALRSKGNTILLRGVMRSANDFHGDGQSHRLQRKRWKPDRLSVVAHYVF